MEVEVIVAIPEVEAETVVAVGVEATVSSVGSLVIGLENAHLVEETVVEVAVILLVIVMVVTQQVIVMVEEIDMEVVEVATAVEIVVVVIAMVEAVTAAEMVAAMGKKGSQTIVKGMVAAAVVVVTDTMVAVTVIQVLETALALMTAPVNAPVVVAVPLMMNVIENILPQEMTHISCI